MEVQHPWGWASAQTQGGTPPWVWLKPSPGVPWIPVTWNPGNTRNTREYTGIRENQVVLDSMPRIRVTEEPGSGWLRHPDPGSSVARIRVP